jgi:ubiquinone/menaquinone biosynthesis C-methylase UbiE
MPQKFDTRQKQSLLSEERHEALQPEVLLRRLGLRKGDTMADIGCGPGFFTLPAASIVGPTGRVFAADIQGEMLTAVRSRAAEAELTNVRVVKTSDTEIPLPAASCNFILMAFVLSELDQRATFLHKAARLLKPKGRLIVVEWVKREEADGPPADERIPLDDLLADATAAGLRLDEREDLDESQYYCVFLPAAEKR